MFAPYCPQHDARVLLSVYDIEGMEHTDGGLVISYHCTCGHHGTWSPAAAA